MLPKESTLLTKTHTVVATFQPTTANSVSADFEVYSVKMDCTVTQFILTNDPITYNYFVWHIADAAKASDVYDVSALWK